MTRKERAALREMAVNWINHVEDGGDSKAAVERDIRSLTKLLVHVHNTAGAGPTMIIDPRTGKAYNLEAGQEKFL